ncbi:hypothetical protein ACHAPE_003526 [Trichoderma viride]
MVPVVYIHGRYGGCNLGVAQALHKLIPNSKIIDDGLNVAYAKANARTAEEYRVLRQALRRKDLSPIYNDKSASGTTWIIVDEFFSKENKASLAADYEFAAVMSHSPLISVIVKHNLELACKVARADTEHPLASSAKAEKLEKLRDECNKEQVFRFRNDCELEFDVTMMSPAMAAETVQTHIQTSKRRLEKKEKRAWIGFY